MVDTTENLLSVAIEIRGLLQLLAEPAIAQRDEKLRATLRLLVGKSQLKEKAVVLMDGSRSQAEIRQLVKIDSGDLSKLVKAMREGGLLRDSEKPHVTIPLPTNFFEFEGGR